MNLTTEQIAVVTTTEQNLGVIAGPGSGKTRTLIERIKILLAGGVDPLQIIAITFTNQAANEIETRLAESFLGAELQFCGTLHSYLLKLIRANAEILGLPSQVTVIDEVRSLEIMKRTIARMNWRGSVEEVFGYTRERGPFGFTGRKRLDKIEIVASEYFQTLITCGMLDFDLILRFGLDIVRRPSSSLAPLQFLFVDEYQDSGPIDGKVYDALLNRTGARGLFIGDPDQSIYGFRGACLTNILDLEAVIPIAKLEGNFRCGQTICDHAQRMIEHNEVRIAKKTVSKTGFMGSVQFGGFTTCQAERAGIFKIMQEFSLDPNETAILVRTNPIAKACREYFGALGVKIAARKYEDLPADWSKLNLFLSLLASPENDVLARDWVEVSQGKKKADSVHFDALQAYQSINGFFLKLECPPLNRLRELLCAESFSMESVHRVEDAIKKLRPGLGILDLIMLLRNEAEPEEASEGLTVSTIHGAKGREWRYVFLPAFEQGTIPDRRSPVEEERRLAYVGITRAKESVFVSFAQQRKCPFTGDMKPTLPSQFIAEMQGV